MVSAITPEVTIVLTYDTKKENTISSANVFEGRKGSLGAHPARIWPVLPHGQTNIA